ncbi:imcF-related N-terminal domain protein, partial [Vibrio parahaemolyticus V-223/04]
GCLRNTALKGLSMALS